MSNFGTYNTTAERVAAAIGPRTKAIMIAHTLGNPFDRSRRSRRSPKQHGLFLVEDNCDAVGSTYKGQVTGTFGDLATVSFYPAHHLTMGEGGCVLTNRPEARPASSSRCGTGAATAGASPGEDNTCHKRFEPAAGRPAIRVRPQVHLLATSGTT